METNNPFAEFDALIRQAQTGAPAYQRQGQALPPPALPQGQSPAEQPPLPPEDDNPLGLHDEEDSPYKHGSGRALGAVIVVCALGLGGAYAAFEHNHAMKGKKTRRYHETQHQPAYISFAIADNHSINQPKHFAIGDYVAQHEHERFRQVHRQPPQPNSTWLAPKWIVHP